MKSVCVSKKVKAFLMLSILVLFTSSTFARKKMKIDGETIVPGVDYVYFSVPSKPPLSIHVLKIDPSKASIALVTADDKCVSREVTSRLAKKCSALAAINGGFCDDSGIPSGVCKVDSSWFSDTKCPRAALGWKQDGGIFLFDILDTKVTLKFDGQDIPVSRLNQMRRDKQAILYTPCFDTTTLTDDGGTEVIIKNNKVIKIQKNTGNSIIPKDGFVYSTGKLFVYDKELIKVGMKVEFDIDIIPSNTSQQDWQDVDFILGGTPLLVTEGQKITDFSQEKILKKFEGNNCARTAVGLLEDGDIIFVVIDNDGARLGNGATLAQLADLMEGFGCTYALNLCGGASTTLYLDGEVINKPFGYLEQLGSYLGIGGEKLIANALVVIPRSDEN